MGIRLAQEWLTICGGCEVTILDLGETLLDLLSNVEIVHMPVIMDHKLYGSTGELKEIDIPAADVGIISGGIRNEEHRVIAREMRKKCTMLVAMGSCACYGGIPALANASTTEELLNTVYRESVSTESDGIPHEQIPPLTDRVYALEEVVKVDLSLPGCPPTPEIFAQAVTALLEGTPYVPQGKSVCDDCPFIREKKTLTALKRPLEPITFTPGAPLNTVRCILEQGFLCLGPVTKNGCGGNERTPRCIRAYMPCRGCFGPVSEKANPLIDMVGALASVGLDPRLIIDRAAMMNRYAGAQGRLRPARPKGENHS